MFPTIELSPTPTTKSPRNVSVQFLGESPQPQASGEEADLPSSGEAGAADDSLAENKKPLSVYPTFEGVTAVERWRFTTRKFLDDPRSSKMAFWFAFWMTITIIVSVVVFCVSTLRQYEGNKKAYTLFSRMELGKIPLPPGLLTAACTKPRQAYHP